MTTTPEFTRDWSATRAHWPDLFTRLGLIGRPGLRFLEIGVFEGQSALWTLEHVLTDPTSTLTLIDPLEFSDIAGEDQRVRLERHLERYFAGGRCQLFAGRSEAVLSGWSCTRALYERFDFVYIDGDHYPAGVMKDAVLSWPLLKPGGHLLFDDYVWKLGGHEGPRSAIDVFCKFWTAEIGSHGRVGEDQYLIEKVA